ncbi:unnamed protein product [Polarella glacialis]|uniref:Uncharacterized protein n=1 Tax=Polarella glacialis TaxID=89957 RepID=A0A813M4R3_POLGL|nr:unnamed protein product [Polarella glacialis]
MFPASLMPKANITVPPDRSAIRLGIDQKHPGVLQIVRDFLKAEGILSLLFESITRHMSRLIVMLGYMQSGSLQRLPWRSLLASAITPDRKFHGMPAKRESASKAGMLKVEHAWLHLLAIRDAMLD